MWQMLANLTSVQVCESPLCSLSETAVVTELVSWGAWAGADTLLLFPRVLEQMDGAMSPSFPQAQGWS